jgi:hypothetical protein
MSSGVKERGVAGALNPPATSIDQRCSLERVSGLSARCIFSLAVVVGGILSFELAGCSCCLLGDLILGIVVRPFAAAEGAVWRA